MRDRVLKPNNSLRSLGFALLNPTYGKCPKRDKNIIKVLAEEHPFLENKTKELAGLTKNIVAQISTLEQYRKSLIHECVTGKRRITEDHAREQ